MNIKIYRRALAKLYAPPRFFFLCALFFMGFAFLSAQEVFDYPLNDDTLARYTEICTRLSDHPLIKGSFEQTKTIMRLGRSLNSKGSFIIAAELGMVWDTVTPFPSTIAVGRDFIIMTGPGGLKTKVDAQGNETFVSIADTMSAVFSGNTRTLRDKFENYFVENRETGTWTLGLIPNDNAVRVFARHIVLTGGSDPVLIQSIVIYSQNGDTISYSMRNHHFPAVLEPNEKDLFSL